MAQDFDLFFEVADAGDGVALLLPAGAEGVDLLFDGGEFLFDFGEAVFGVAVGLALEGGAFDFEGGGAAFELIELGGDAANLDGEGGGGFVNEVYGFVGEEAVGDVAMRESGGGNDGGIFDADVVMGFVALFEAAEDGNGVFDIGLADKDDLEAAFEGGDLSRCTCDIR